MCWVRTFWRSWSSPWYTEQKLKAVFELQDPFLCAYKSEISRILLFLARIRFQITKRLLLSLFLAMSATIKDFYSFSFERRKWRRIHSIQARHNRERRRMEWRNFLSWVGVEKCFWNRSHFRFKLKLQWHPARSRRRIFGSLDAKKMELPSLCFARIMHWE